MCVVFLFESDFNWRFLLPDTNRTTAPAAPMGKGARGRRLWIDGRSRVEYSEPGDGKEGKDARAGPSSYGWDLSEAMRRTRMTIRQAQNTPSDRKPKKASEAARMRRSGVGAQSAQPVLVKVAML